MMMPKINLFIAFTLYCGAGQIVALEDGDFYKIIHPASGNKVLTVGSDGPVDGAEMKMDVWKNEPNQKWLAVQAVVAGDNYLLLPQQQRWIWSHFLRNGESLRETKERHDSLPDWSLVLNGDSRGQVQVQPRDSKKYQQWRSEVASSNSGSSKVIIKNLQDNKCLQAPGTWSSTSSQGSGSDTPAATPGFFRRVRNWFGGLFGGSSSTNTATITTTSRPNDVQSTTSTSKKVELVACDKNSAGQQWTLEKISIR